MTMREWLRQEYPGLSRSVPEDDPERERARRAMALADDYVPGPPPPGGWESDPAALGAELRRLREASEPLVVAAPPEVLPAAEPRVVGYVAVVRHEDRLRPVGSIGSAEWTARNDVQWWAENVGPGAFMAELREVPE